MTMLHGDREEARVTMCIVIDYADPCWGGWRRWRSVKTRRWLDTEGERKWRGKPLKSAKSARRTPQHPRASPNKKPPPLPLPAVPAKEENRGGEFQWDKYLLEKQCLLCSFLIYEVLRLKKPSANRQFCDTRLLFFPALL